MALQQRVEGKSFFSFTFFFFFIEYLYQYLCFFPPLFSFPLLSFLFSCLYILLLTHYIRYAPTVLQDAIFFVNQDHEPEEAIAASLRFAGPSNFCPVLVGAFCGAITGRSGIRMRAKHELRECSGTIIMRMDAVAQDLALTWPEDDVEASTTTG